VWENEKKVFKGGATLINYSKSKNLNVKPIEYRGIEGKVELICEFLEEFTWEKGKNPYQKIKKLEDFRDLMVHPKMEKKNIKTEVKEDGSHFIFDNQWDEFFSGNEDVEEYKNAIKSFCEELRASIEKRGCEHPHIKFPDFEGSLGSGSGQIIRRE